MECEKCGAEIDEGAGTCPECGEPVAAEVAPAADEPILSADVSTPDAPARAERSGPGGKKWLIAVLAVVVAGLAAAGWFLLPKLLGATDSPESAVMAMLSAYAEYDAQGILDTATHKSLPADGVKEFEKQASEAKTRAGGKPGVKDFKVIKTTMDSETQATVEITGQWLTDPAKGTYTKRTEKLTVVKQDGKWLVKLF